MKSKYLVRYDESNSPRLVAISEGKVSLYCYSSHLLKQNTLSYSLWVQKYSTLTCLIAHFVYLRSTLLVARWDGEYTYFVAIFNN